MTNSILKIKLPKWNVIFFSVWAILVVYSIIDNFILNPRESVRYEDKAILEKELNEIMATTSNLGIWSNINTIYRQSIVVSATFINPAHEQHTNKIIVALKKNAWQEVALSRPKMHLLAALCKGRYRANLWSMEYDDSKVSLSLLVKELKSEKCSTL